MKADAGPPPPRATAPSVAPAPPVAATKGRLVVQAWDGATVTVVETKQQVTAHFPKPGQHAVAVFELPPGSYNIVCVDPLEHSSIRASASVVGEKSTYVESCFR